MKILFLTNLYPYPLNSGGVIHSYTVLKALSNMGCDIDLFCFKDRASDVTKGIQCISSVTFVYHKIISATNKFHTLFKCLVSLFILEPFVVFKFRSKEMKKALNDRLELTDYDFIYIDHFNLGVYYPIIKKSIDSNRTQIILNEHNCEYKIMETNCRQEKNFFKKCFLCLEMLKVKRYEIGLIEKVDFTTVLTEEDYIDLRKASNKDFRHAVIPVGIPKHSVKEFKNVENSSLLKLLFVGTLTWEPNNHGICWFVKNVMPRLKDNAKLTIVGKNPSKELVNLCENHTDIDVLGFVDDLDKAYNDCDVMVAPIFIGSGQKVKVMEAFSRRCPVISTAFAAKGIPHHDGENIIIADNEDEFVSAVEKLKELELRKMIATKGYEVYQEFFSEETVVGSVQKYIDDLLISH